MWAASVTPVVKMLKERKKNAEKKKKKVEKGKCTDLFLKREKKTQK